MQIVPVQPFVIDRMSTAAIATRTRRHQNEEEMESKVLEQ